MSAKKTEPKKKVCISLTRQDYERLRDLSEKSSRTVPGFIRWLIHSYFRHPFEE